MKKLLVMFILPLFLLAFDKSVAHPKLLSGKWCEVCGMNLAKFYKTNYAVIFKDGRKKEFCSLRCFAKIYPKVKEKVKEIFVVDAKSAEWIDAKRAWYVIGSDVQGTMSHVSKLAFKTKEGAKEFIKKHGGKLATFKEALAKAQEDLLKEERMMAKKRSKMAKLGEMIYKKRCKEVKGDFATIAHLKDKLQEVCAGIKGKKLQAVAIYLWSKSHKKHIHPPKDAKCPVCGMFVAKYPRWATMIVDKSGKKFYFDGVKDMMKYMKLQKHPVKRAYVSDYYTLGVVDALKAWYVIGSDVLGPMGKELIPFKNKEEALGFIKDHRGRVLSFDQIDERVIKEVE